MNPGTDGICPLCNGLGSEGGMECPVCGGRLGDRGRVEDILDPYCAYLGQGPGETHIPEARPRSDTCRHILVCGDCGYRQETLVPRVTG